MNCRVIPAHNPVLRVAEQRITIDSSTLHRACDKRGETLRIEYIGRICLEEQFESAVGQTDVDPGRLEIRRIDSVIGRTSSTKPGVEVGYILRLRDRGNEIFE